MSAQKVPLDSAALNALWDAFLDAWPAEKLPKMKLAEYSNDKKTGFVYWLEKKTEDLGSIWGGSAFKFGIYHQRKVKKKPTGAGMSWGAQYAWFTKYGDTEAAAFATVRARIVEVVRAIRDRDLARIEAVDLSPVIKWKIAFLYQDRSAPLLFPIYKKQALFHHYRKIDPAARLSSTPYDVMYQTLMAKHRGTDVFSTATALWQSYQAQPPGARAWAVPLAWILDEAAIEELCALERVEAEDLDASVAQLLSASEIAEGDELALLVGDQVRAVGVLTESEAGHYAWDQTPVDFASGLATQPTSEARLLDSEERDQIWSHLGASSPAEELVAPAAEAPSTPPAPRNIILFGPPGTGKTYSTIRRALELILGADKLEGLERAELIALFREHQARGQVELVTFHQAYGYEEFVEGIRPVLGGSAEAGVRYELHDGVFKRIALRACADGLRIGEETERAKIELEFDVLWDRLLELLSGDDVVVRQSQQGHDYKLVATSRGNVVVERVELDDEGGIASEMGRRQTASREGARLLWQARGTLGPVESWSYKATEAIFAKERGIGGGHHYTALWIAMKLVEELARQGAAVKPGASLVVDRELVQKALDKPGATTGFSFSAQTPQYVLIIDEINRGNMSRILGELITLLEDDKRLGAESELKLPLLYSPDHRFAVPPNLHILGTMNTADRSIALMDVALRRRFTFEELMPEVEVIRKELAKKRVSQPFIELVADLFETLNARIRFLYDRDHQLGHSYFLRAIDLEKLRTAFVDRVIPMLQEYFYGAWDKISAVLGCPYGDAAEPQRAEPHLLAPTSPKAYCFPLISARRFIELETLGFDHDGHEDRLDHQVAELLTDPAGDPDQLFAAFLGVLNLDAPTFASRLATLTESGAEA